MCVCLSLTWHPIHTHLPSPNTPFWKQPKCGPLSPFGLELPANCRRENIKQTAISNCQLSSASEAGVAPASLVSAKKKIGTRVLQRTSFRWGTRTEPVSPHSYLHGRNKKRKMGDQTLRYIRAVTDGGWVVADGGWRATKAVAA